MAVLISVGGNSAGDGFLLAPLGTTYEVDILLSTDVGTANVTIQAAPPNPAGLVFSSMGPFAISPAPILVTVHATLQSASRGDTIIQVLPSGGGAPLATFAVTSISFPVVNFRGRFEARFATDGSLPYLNKKYTAAVDTISAPTGWTWGLEGEPDFVPLSGPAAVPENLDTTGLGRVIRLNNPVALRSHALPVVSTVVSITGQTTGGPQTFPAGDPLINMPVNFGPHTYFAGNNSPSTPGTPQPEEFWGAAQEPLGLFEFRIGASFSPPSIYFRGKSNVGPFVAKATGVNQHTRSPDSRPIANGMPAAATEFAEVGLALDPTVFGDARIDALLVDYNALPVGPSLARRNLNRRIGHLLFQGPAGFEFASTVSPAKYSDVQTNPPGPFTVRNGTLLLGPPPPMVPAIWNYKEHYVGKVDADLHAWPGASPGASAVITYMTEFAAGFNFQWDAFAFHSDELCGYHKGSLATHISFHGGHIGDPHVRTVDGTNYDFQAVGEFTLLRNGERMEVQVRQTPVATAHPITDSYTGLTACVSINTAVAARVGKNRVSLQPGREGSRLQFYLNGKPASLTADGIDLGSDRVSAFDAGGETGLRIDYEDGTVVTVTPAFWTAHNVSYINVTVSNTQAHQGVMGFKPRESWLPRLRNGATVGAMPANLQDRYSALYKTFADSWRVTNQSSLFVYAAGTSTKTFTDRDWPAAKPPCKLKPQFQIPGVPLHRGLPLDEAELICNAVTDGDLHKNCVFDVATTGDKIFAKGYRLAQDLRLYDTAVQITGFVPAIILPDRSDRCSAREQPPATGEGDFFAVTATVVPLTPGRPKPTGAVSFFVDGMPMRRPVELDDQGRARLTIGPLKFGEHKIRAVYSGGGKYEYHSSSSPNLFHTAAPRKKPNDNDVPPKRKIPKRSRAPQPAKLKSAQIGIRSKKPKQAARQKGDRK